jgi:capsular polysaccharide transport system ATP-binding protein
MLVVDRLSKAYERAGRPLVLFENLSFSLKHTDRLGVLGRNGQGKSTLIKILGGVTAPTAGKVRWSMTSSWPLGFGGAFQGGLTGIDNIRFIARIYDQPFAPLFDRVERFAELGDALGTPVKHYSSGMRARLAFGLSLGIDFDCYLIDEVISVGDALFREKCENELFGKLADRSFIMASHDTEFLRRTCNCALVINSGVFEWHDDVDTAVEAYDAICRAD